MENVPRELHTATNNFQLLFSFNSSKKVKLPANYVSLAQNLACVKQKKLRMMFTS